MTQVTEDAFPSAQPDRARPVPRPRRKRDYALAAIVLVSLAIHASVLLPLLFTAKPAAPPSVETPVEVIQEPPPEPKKEPVKPEKDAAKEAQAKAEAEQAKAEKARAEQAKADQAKAEQAKAEQAKAEKEKAKAERAKAEEAKELAKPKPLERKTAKAEPPKPPAQPPQAAKAVESQADVAARMRSLLGQPPPSLDPVALPGEGADGTIGATYEQLVMSRLTKAVDMERHPGRPGFATVTFVVGERGEVVSVDLNRPSGDPLLDSEATEVVKRAAPFPVPPVGAKRTFTVTLQSRPVP